MLLLARMLKHYVRSGTLRVIDANGKQHVFSGGSGPAVTVRLHDKSLNWRLILNPELYAGEAYMNSVLTVEEGSLSDALQLFFINLEIFKSNPVEIFFRRIRRLFRPFQRKNHIRRSKKNVASHYDLSRKLFELFLDGDLNYSCGYFLNEKDPLENAQGNKIRHIAAKLLLKPGQKILDIGSGWGSLAFNLARYADVEVTGVTLSAEQCRYSSERAEALGLSDRVHFELRDYREINERFDRIVSVGMFEHVGFHHYGEFFAKVHELLADDGVALIHSIGRMSPPGTTSPWGNKYIFPGGYIPALSEVLTAVEPQGIWVTDIEILRVHYADTIREWRGRFETNRKKIVKFYGEHFCRMWELYLAGAEMAFLYGNRMVFQMQLAKNLSTVPLTRNYITEAECAYRRGERAEHAARDRQRSSILFNLFNSLERNSNSDRPLYRRAVTWP